MLNRTSCLAQGGFNAVKGAACLSKMGHVPHGEFLLPAYVAYVEVIEFVQTPVFVPPCTSIDKRRQPEYSLSDICAPAPSLVRSWRDAPPCQGFGDSLWRDTTKTQTPTDTRAKLWSPPAVCGSRRVLQVATRLEVPASTQASGKCC